MQSWAKHISEDEKQENIFMHTLNILISVCLIILAYFDIYSLLPVLHKKQWSKTNM